MLPEVRRYYNLYHIIFGPSQADKEVVEGLDPLN